MRRLLFVWMLLCSLMPLPSLAQADAAGYDFPYANPYAATIVGTPREQQAPFVPDLPVKLLDLTVFPEREVPEVFWYNERLRAALAYQKGKAPLIFVIAGTGSGFNSDKMLRLQNAFFQAGFHVVTLSSPTHANFVTTASETETPGILRDDARDLYRVMRTIWDQVKDEIEVSDFHLTGFSLGGTQAAFVSELDEREKAFKFRKVLMINPAVSVYASMTKLDHMLEDNIRGGVGNLQNVLDRALQKFAQVYAVGDFVKFDHEFLFNIYRGLPEPPKEESLEAVIGLSFRISSSNMIFASDVMTKSGFVVPRDLVLSSNDPLDEYLRTLSYVSFGKYLHEFLLPAAQARDPTMTLQTLIDSNGLKAIDGYLKRTEKLGVLTNADDIILGPGDIDYLRSQFGSRATIFPRGGHGGNIDHRTVVAAITGYFTRP